jgi:hypothetical protein
VQWAVTHPASGIPCREALLFTVDTDLVCQMLLSAPTLRELGIRATIVFPQQGGRGRAGGADGSREIVDCSRLPHSGTESIAFSMLLWGCDYTSSALGFGLDPARVLLSATAAPAAFSVREDRVVIRGPSLLGLLAQLKDSKKKPRKMYLCSAGRRHLSKQAAAAASRVPTLGRRDPTTERPTPERPTTVGSRARRSTIGPLGNPAPPAVERNSRDLYKATMSILHVLWYWRFGGSSAPQAGPPPLSGTLADVFGDGTLAEILAGRGPHDMAPEVTVGGRSGEPIVDNYRALETLGRQGTRSGGTPSPPKRRRHDDSSTDEE